MTTPKAPSQVLAERLEILNRKSLDARARGASLDELTSIGEQIEQQRNELFQRRAEEQKERMAAANERMLGARNDIEREHIQWQQSTGASPGSYTSGSLRK